MKILFEDAKLRHHNLVLVIRSEDDMITNNSSKYHTVDEALRITACINKLDDIYENDRVNNTDSIVYTNQLFALDRKYVWKDSNHIELYLRDKFTGEWNNCTRFTKLSVNELRESKIDVLYLSNKFSDAILKRGE